MLSEGDVKQVSEAMMRTNPCFTWREWLVAPAYKKAALGENHLVHELQAVFSAPYDALPQTLRQIRPLSLGVLQRRRRLTLQLLILVDFALPALNSFGLFGVNELTRMQVS